MKPYDKKQEKINYKQLRLVDIVPGKLYAYDNSSSVPKIDLITFECSEEHGALRGFVKVFYGSTEVFPTEVYARGHWLTVNTINQDGIERPMRLHFDEKTKELKLLSDRILTDTGILSFQNKLIETINAKEDAIARELFNLRNLYDLMKKV
jgi:hypothetical protein